VQVQQIPSFKVSHVTKTRHAHQVTATCIHALLKQAYDEYTSESGINLPLEQWCLSQATAEFNVKLLA